MSRFGPRARLVGILAFAVVWGGVSLRALQTGDLGAAAGGISGDPFPPGTITPALLAEESCGDFEIVSSFAETARQHPTEFRCLYDALDSGRRVVLVLRGLTGDGDPWRAQVRVLGSDHVEFVVDDTRNHDGNGVITRFLCDEIDPVSQRPDDCESAPLEE